MTLAAYSIESEGKRAMRQRRQLTRIEAMGIDVHVLTKAHQQHERTTQ